MDEQKVMLPPMPEPDGSAEIVVGHEQVGRYLAEVQSIVDAWSEPLVRAYATEAARLAVLAERERCAEICERQEPFEYGDWAHGYRHATEKCAAAIRNQEG